MKSVLHLSTPGRARDGISRRRYRQWIPALFILSTSSMANAQLPTHDSFTGRLLNLSAWNGGWISPNALEANRHISGGKLNLSVHSFGERGESSGWRRATNAVELHDRFSGLVNLIQTRSQMDRGQSRFCPDGDQRSRGRLRSYITWFNDGSSTGPDDQTGDVASYIGLRAYGNNNPEIRLWAWRCSNASCSTTDDIVTGDNFLGAVNFGVPVLTRMAYAKATNTLSFAAKIPGRAWATLRYSLDGIATYANPPANTWNVIEARSEVDNCNLTTGQPVPYAMVEGKFDHVWLRLFPQ